MSSLAGKVLRIAAAFLLIMGAQSVAAKDLEVASNGVTIKVAALSDAVVRIRLYPSRAVPEDASWAVAAPVRAQRASVTLSPNTLSTRGLTVTVDPRTLEVRVTDLAKNVILEDSAAVEHVGNSFTLRKKLSQQEHIFGLGDKTGALDRRGSSFVDWNTDSFGFTSSTDPIYKSIPFFISTGGAGGAYGVLLDTTWRSWFDFGHRDDGVAAFGANDGPIDYYVIAGPTIPDVVRRYTTLTGRAALPPRWALGYQQSRWSYMSEAEVREVAERLRKERVPTDVIWLDIDYQDRNRPFTIDRKTFPHFENMVRDLDAEAIKLVAIVDLHIADAPDQGYAPYDAGVKGDHFVRRADGSRYVGPVWPGPSVFPEFTRADTRRWWGTLFKPFTDAGIAGIWNDMNEPAIFETPTKTMPLDVRHRIAGDDFISRTATHAEIHNVYGMENSRATFEGLRTLRPDERAFVMTRASYAGGQRYAATWTGDNSATWDHLRLSVQQTLNLGLSGFAWTGADVGGFTGGPTPELLTRWFQYAAFAPIFRDHSSKGTRRVEPWVDGPDHLAIRRHYVEERYRLMPYLYALAETNARTGDPIMRPLFYDYLGTLGTSCDTSMTFTLGAALLVAGAPKPEQTVPYEACLPTGGWYDYWTGAKVAGQPSPDEHGATLQLTPSLATLPVFVRAGTILPKQPLVQSTQQRPTGALELHVYPGPECRGEIYDDDGHSMDFAHGVYLRQTVTCTMTGEHLLRIDIAPREGTFSPWWNGLRLVIHGGARYRATMGRHTLAVESTGNNAVALSLPDQPGGATIALAAER